MLVEELMHRDIDTIDPNDTVEDAARLMRDDDIGFLPVIDDKAKVLGTITDRDIVVRAVANHRFDAKVSDMMSTEVVSCQATDDIRRAEQLMSENQIVRLVVCDDLGRLLGVLSFSDIAAWEGDDRRMMGTLRQVKEQQEPARH